MIDGLSLFNHFIVIPAVHVALILPLLHHLIPNFKGSVNLSWPWALVANMVVDYGWYWNHRLFHARTKLWSLHAVHHEPESLDMFKTSRNTFWSPFLMVYFWLIPLFIFLAKDPAPFLWIAGAALLVNFWGHTHFNLPKGSFARKVAATFLIQPKDHYWHHSSEQPYCNFATVFNFWDKIHGTWYESAEVPEKLGFKLDYSLLRKAFLPKL